MTSRENQQSTMMKKLSLVEVLTATLAAVSSAVAASALGVGGTIVGAAVGSVVATISAALYSHSLARGKERWHERLFGWIRLPGVTRRAGASQTAGTADAITARATAVPSAAPSVSGPPTARSGTVYGGRRKRPWRLMIASAAAVFGLAVGSITFVELAFGHPLANLFGGHASGTTSLTSLSDQGSGAPAPTQSPTVDPSSTAEPSPTATPSTPATPDPSVSATPEESTSASPTDASTSTGETPDPAQPSGAP